jgi:uncharacterized membrane protein YgcG
MALFDFLPWVKARKEREAREAARQKYEDARYEALKARQITREAQLHEVQKKYLAEIKSSVSAPKEEIHYDMVNDVRKDPFDILGHYVPQRSSAVHVHEVEACRSPTPVDHSYAPSSYSSCSSSSSSSYDSGSSCSSSSDSGGSSGGCD